MRRATTVLAALTAATGFALGMPVAAHAASGSFSYTTTTDGVRHSLGNPESGQCYTVEIGGWAEGRTRNDTDRTAELFDQPHCQGAASSAIPADDQTQARFRSVRFVS